MGCLKGLCSQSLARKPKRCLPRAVNQLHDGDAGDGGDVHQVVLLKALDEDGLPPPSGGVHGACSGEGKR